MRQRKIKNIEEKLAIYEKLIVKNPKESKGRWMNLFKNENPIYLEIGCGKGQFITDMALRNKDSNFIAIEGHQSVVLRALEKANDNQCENVRFIVEYINDIQTYFHEDELNGIYLNFSDPWPKERHEKRRLTHGNRLRDYAKVIKAGGFIQFKTDNDGLFDFTLNQIELAELKITEMSRNLHNSQFSAKNITTEYEDKFTEKGKNINYVRIRVN